MSRISFDPSFSETPPRCLDKSTARITVMGDNRCGKTSLVLRWLRGTYRPVEHGAFFEDIYHRTLLFHQFMQKHLEREGNGAGAVGSADLDELQRYAAVDVQVLDCESGDADYDNVEVRTAQIKQSDGFIVCFDPHSGDPFEDVFPYIHRIREILGDAVIVVCSTKSDLNPEAEYKLEAIDEQLQSCGLSVAEDFVEVSAKTGTNVEKLFCKVLGKISQHKQLARSSYMSGHSSGREAVGSPMIGSVASSETFLTPPVSLKPPESIKPPASVSPPEEPKQEPITKVKPPRAVIRNKDLQLKPAKKSPRSTCCIIC